MLLLSWPPAPQTGSGGPPSLGLPRLPRSGREAEGRLWDPPSRGALAPSPARTHTSVSGGQSRASANSCFQPPRPSSVLNRPGFPVQVLFEPRERQQVLVS